MFGRRLEDQLWENSRALERTLDSYAYAHVRTGNDFLVYELRQPDPSSGIRGAFLAVRRKAFANSIGRAIFGNAGSLEEAVEAINSLPAQSYSRQEAQGRIYSLNYLVLSGTVGAMVAAVLVEGSATVGGLVIGSLMYIIFPSCARSFFGLPKAIFRYALSVDQYKAPSNGLSDLIEGKEALTAMLQLTEIRRIRM